MRKFILFAFVISIFAVSASSSHAQVLTEVLRRMDMNNKSLQSVKADVTMVKTNSQLGESDTYKGMTSYLPKTGSRPMYARIDWSKPVEEQIAVVGESYELFRPRLNQVIQGKTNGAKSSGTAGGALAFMSMSKDQLKANYDVQYLGEEQVSGAVQTWHLKLTPKAKQSYKLAELWVDKDGMPRQAKVTEQNDDTTTVHLSDIKKNERIQADQFRLAYDKKKVKIVQG